MNIDAYTDAFPNKRLILNKIFNGKGISRNDIVVETSLSPATVTKFAAELLAEGVIQETGELESTGGRKPTALQVTPACAYIICVDIGSYLTRIGVAGFDCELIECKQVPTKGFDFSCLCQQIDELLSRYGKERILGIGVGISGLVDNRNNSVIFCPNIKQWNSVELGRLLFEKYGIYTRVNTSARCMIYAERFWAGYRGYDNQVFISVGHGIGVGIVIDSKVFYGQSGFAGEMGHIRAAKDQHPCSCGNIGCLENVVTLPLIIRHVQQALKKFQGYSPLLTLVGDIEHINKDYLRQALEKGDKIVYDELVSTGEDLGAALAILANLFNPALIVLGGGVIENFPMVVAEAARTLREKSLIPISQDLSVVASKLDSNAAVKGCALMICEAFLGRVT